MLTSCEKFRLKARSTPYSVVWGLRSTRTTTEAGLWGIAMVSRHQRSKEGVLLASEMGRPEMKAEKGECGDSKSAIIKKNDQGGTDKTITRATLLRGYERSVQRNHEIRKAGTKSQERSQEVSCYPRSTKKVRPQRGGRVVTGGGGSTSANEGERGDYRA